MPYGPDIAGFAVISGTRVILPVEVATIDATVLLPVVATVGTILSGAVTVNVSGATIEVGTVVAVLDTATIGTILSGAVTAVVATIQSPAAVVLPTGTVVGTTGQFAGTASGTIRGTGGTLYGIVAMSEAGTGTLILIHNGGITLTKIAIPAGDTRGFSFANGIAYTGSLIGSVQGTIVYSVVS